MRDFLRANLLILVLMNLGNLFNYLFQVVAARALSTDDYGIFNTLLSLIMVISAPVTVLPMVFSRFTVRLSQTGMGQVHALLVSGLRVLTLVAVLLCLAGAIAAPWLKDYLHLHDGTAIAVMVGYLGLAMVYPVVLGVLQGLHRYAAFGTASSGVMVVRFLVGLLLLYPLALRVNGALSASVLGALFALLFGWWALRDLRLQPLRPLPAGLGAEMLRYSLPVFAATAMIMMLGNLDLVLVRHYIPGEQAGLYATAAVLGRIAFFLPAMLVAVLFPTVARARESGDESRKPFLVSLALTAVLGLSFALLCILWPQWIIGLLFGAKYAAAAPLLQIVSLAMALLAIVQVVVTYGLARADYLSLPPLALGVVLMFALALLYHQSALVIAWIVLGAVVFILAGSLGAWLYRDRPWKAA